MPNFNNETSAEYLLQANDALLTIIQIETKEALQNVSTYRHGVLDGEY